MSVAEARTNVAQSTARHYAADFRRFDSWCAAHKQSSLPASLDSIVAFVRDELEQGFAVSTINRRLAAIAAAHARAGETAMTRDQRVRRLLGPA